MSQKKYVSLSKLSTFLDNLYDKFTEIGHKHKLDDITDYVVDSQLSSTSINPVQNKVIDAEFEEISKAMNILELAIDEKADGATTLAGYGITDAYTESEIDNMLSSKADKATTIAGYSITDAYTKTQIDNLELITVADIDAICNVTYVNASDSGVTF